LSQFRATLVPWSEFDYLSMIAFAGESAVRLPSSPIMVELWFKWEQAL